MSPSVAPMQPTFQADIPCPGVCGASQENVCDNLAPPSLLIDLMWEHALLWRDFTNLYKTSSPEYTQHATGKLSARKKVVNSY